MTVEVVCTRGKCEYVDKDIHDCVDCDEVELIEHQLLKENV